MSGIFAQWQPVYAEMGIATFPVRGKRPAVRSYLTAGLNASGQFANQFADAEAFGFACRPAKITVVDVDSTNESLLADALNEFGHTPVIVRSGSGHFQAWYRRRNEGRIIRLAGRPIDVLGAGFVVAPPSIGKKGSYELISGSLHDLAHLPMIKNIPRLTASKRPAKLVCSDDSTHTTAIGSRNSDLWRSCMVKARSCSDFEDLVAFANVKNHLALVEPLPDAEVLGIAISAWKYQVDGKNWFGTGGRIVINHEDIDGLMNTHPDAFLLLTKLQRHHWNREFVIANAMAEIMPPSGWTVKRFAAARKALQNAGKVILIRTACKGIGPALYRWP